MKLRRKKKSYICDNSHVHVDKAEVWKGLEEDPSVAVTYLWASSASPRMHHLCFTVNRDALPGGDMNAANLVFPAS